MPFAGHPLIEILLEFACFEEAGSERAITVAEDSSDLNVLLDFLVGFKPDTAQWFSGTQVHVPGSRECEQTVSSSAG